jgi:tetratricopeptide (TPR) repeat protein
VAVRALAWQSEFCRALGKRDSARRLQQQGLTLLKEPALSGCDTRLERAILSWTMGLTAWITDYERASKHFEESFSLFSELEHKWGLASALMNWGTMNMLLCSFQNAERQLEEALTIWRVLGSPVGVADCLSRLAIVASTRGRLEKAEHLAREGYAMSLQAGSRLQAGQNQLYLGRTLEDLGRFSEAHALVQKSLALLSAVGHRVHLSHVPGYLARILMHLGKYEQAREHSEAGLASARKYGPGWCVGLNLDLQGCLDLAAGAPARAYDHFQDAIAVYRDVGERDDLAWGFSVFAFAALALGNAGEARHHLLAALQFVVDLGMYGPPVLWALPAAALLLNDEGEKERAVELYALASRYDLVAKSRWFADMVGKQIAAAADTLTAERVAILQESGRTRNLEAMAAELLAELCE